MRAAVYQGKQQFSVEEIPTPTPGPGEILVEIKYCAICGTDVHAFLYDVPDPGTVMGHEYCGTVAELGPGVTRWKQGDRVVGGGGMPPAGEGPGFMTDPRFNFRTMGYAENRLRAYAEYVLMPEWQLLAIPDEVPDESAAMCEPCAVAVHAVRVSELKLGDSVGIIGAGPIGLLCLQTARAAGASTVLMSEPVEARRKAAVELGADAVMDPASEDVVAEMVSRTNGLGPDVVFDCAGIRSTLDDAMTIVRRSGQVVLVAVPWEQMPLLPVDWMAREVKLQTSWGSRPTDWRIALDLLGSGRVTVAPMLSEASFLPLEEIQRAFEDLTKPDTQVQVVMEP